MLASYDKIIKYLVEKIQAALSPLEQIAKNQEIIVVQNKQIIDLLTQLNPDRQTVSETVNEITPPSALPQEFTSEE